MMFMYVFVNQIIFFVISFKHKCNGRKPEYPERNHAYTGRTCHVLRLTGDSKLE